MDEPIIALSNVSKSFGTVKALKDMSLALYPGEVHVLLGENGAGKSTLVNTLVGNYAPDAGTITLRGDVLSHYSPAIARENGINVVLQDFGLAPTLTVAENLYLGREKGRFGFVDRKGEIEGAAVVLKSLGAEFDPTTEIESLTRAEQQLVEIAKGVLGRPGALLLDEPTASISESESERLFVIVARLREQGWAILYITHRLEEMQRLGDRVTVMRDGRLIASHLKGDVPHSQLIAEMVGRPLEAVYPAKASSFGELVLRVDDIATDDGKVRGVSLNVRRGEIVGIAGLVGCGKGDVAKSIMGISKLTHGEIEVAGRSFRRLSPSTMIDAGVGYMPEDRRRQALALELSVEDNMALEIYRERPYSSFGISHLSRVGQVAERLVQQLDIRPKSLKIEVGSLSGGNQQKVVLARSLTRHRDVYVVVEPTAGVDIGARAEIYANMRRLCDSGAGVLLVSSDLEEVVGMCNRVYVMNSGSITLELNGDGINNESIVAGAFGHTQDMIA